MLKYVDTAVTLAEVPDEITLCINISNCPCHCSGCHSPYLAEDIGKELNTTVLEELIRKNEGISCVAFMGGDSNPSYINTLASSVRVIFPDIKVAWYSGRQELSEMINLSNFDYIKLGPYIKEKGPLDYPDTNQRFYEVIYRSKLDHKYTLYDITGKFWK